MLDDTSKPVKVAHSTLGNYSHHTPLREAIFVFYDPSLSPGVCVLIILLSYGTSAKFGVETVAAIKITLQPQE